ncbi:MAG: hypothetical protein ACD_37C00623G0001 [uncultured bacterium]|nr:MAG: hypothetical protein ACD_37C00623G0001 [uncultured bacterium]
MVSSENLSITTTKLNRISWLSRQDPGKEFNQLMHYYNVESLKECFHLLDGSKAAGIDKITKDDYAKNLDANLQNLIDRMKTMSYRPNPVREVLIPKEGKPGAFRPLGISNFEDKIVQKMTQRVLESIYDPLFLDCSYGFRPKRGCHDAIKDLTDYLYKNENQIIIDIDLKNFFGTIDHKMLENILRMKIKDSIFMRYIIRMFKAGTLSKNDLKVSEEGVPQGNISSPILANIFAHYVIDIWVEKMVKPRCKGKVSLFRFADDGIICCEIEEDAEKIKDSLTKRLNKFKLILNKEKTKLVSFDKRKARLGIRQGTFDFLGFTFYWGASRNGYTIPKLKTKAKTMRNKLNKFTQWIKLARNKMPLKEIWKIYQSVLRGTIGYYGVSHNISNVNKFINISKKIMFKWLNRRSQKRSFNWDKFKMFEEANPLPKAKIVHKLF